jgi:asparagine synthase (glutamine-hydrolysing)
LTVARRIRLAPIEAATDDGIGEAPLEPDLPPADRASTPLEALQEAILPALERGPCFVMFSGGRDSSVVLAAAVWAARNNGLPLPVPITHVHPGYPETEESDWQRVVLAHLRVTEHVRHLYGDDFNLLGPAMRESVRRNGIMAPAGGHLLIPTLEEARGGSLVTGIDGDALFNGGGFGPLRAAIRSGRLFLRFPLSVARAMAPIGVRERVARARDNPAPAWLTPPNAARYMLLRAHHKATEPFRWGPYLQWLVRQRRLAALRQTTATLAAAYDVAVFHPFLDRTFLSTMASVGGLLGFGDRTSALRSLFGTLLPNDVLERTTKAVFTRPYFGGDVKDFARDWDGSGVPRDLVDPDILRDIWLSEWPDARTGLLLHAAWAATLPLDERPNLVDCSLE